MCTGVRGELAGAGVVKPMGNVKSRAVGEGRGIVPLPKKLIGERAEEGVEGKSGP